MKKTTLVIMSALLVFTTTLQSCIGSFSLTRKVYEFNKSVGNNWIQELVFLVFCAIPVYGIATFIDAVILNLIEFWTGSNPLSMNEGDIEIQYKKGIDGNNYKLTATKNRLHILQIDGTEKGKEMAFTYNPDNTTWSIEKDGMAMEIAKVNYNENGMAENYTIYTPEGLSINVDASLTKAQAAALIKNYKTELAIAQ
ncbi:MAG: DUF3332 domain-containing protein [Bacteroidia bacterium]